MLAQQKKDNSWDNNNVAKRNVKLNTNPRSRVVYDALRSRCIVLFIITTILAGFFIYRNGVATVQAYHLNQIRSQTLSLEAENSRLHLDIAYLKSPEHIQEIATQQLGMILPEKFFFSNKK